MPSDTSSCRALTFEDVRSDILSLLLFSFKKLLLFIAVLKVLVIRQTKAVNAIYSCVMCS